MDVEYDAELAVEYGVANGAVYDVENGRSNDVESVNNGVSTTGSFISGLSAL